MGIQINIFVVIYLLFLHWIADFVCQTDEMAQGKSKSWYHLLSHTITYSCIFWLGFGLIGIIKMVFYHSSLLLSAPILFGLITFVFHTTQDYITSRINSRFFSEKKTHLFFTSIGFDQLLHFIQLLLTYQLLK